MSGWTRTQRKTLFGVSLQRVVGNVRKEGIDCGQHPATSKSSKFEADSGTERLFHSRSQRLEKDFVEKGRSFLSLQPPVLRTKTQLAGRVPPTHGAPHDKRRSGNDQQTLKKQNAFGMAAILEREPTLSGAAADKASAHSIRSRKMENSSNSSSKSFIS